MKGRSRNNRVRLKSYRPIDLARRRLLVALPMFMLAGPLAAMAERDKAPRRERGGTRIDVRSTGARGDGVTDDTAAFQRAIDGLPADGGTVAVPDGDYLIDPTRSVQLRSRMHLQLAPGARLLAKPNAEEKTFVLEVARVNDVEISGGRIVGDRDKHLGTTGEWGHGIAIYGAKRVTVRDIHVSRCWGDGIGIAGKRAKKTDKRIMADPSEDVVLANVISTGNRRQALTIGHSRDVRVYHCRFSDTAGTAPQCGIDLEPDKPHDVRRALIENCRIDGNQGSGIQVYLRVYDVTIRGCTIENNRRHGILAVAAVNGVIEDNQIHGNGSAGVGLKGPTRNYEIRGNRFRNNSVRRRSRPKKAKGPEQSHIQRAQDASEITLTDNHFFDEPEG
jgi:parallel beta-helix repeat protein